MVALTKNLKKAYKMTVTETLIRRLFDLSEAEKHKILIFIEKLDISSPAKRKTLNDPYGICADIRTNLNFEAFQKNRQSLWGQSTNDLA